MNVTFPDPGWSRGHNGLVVLNDSRVAIAVDPGDPDTVPTEISGSAAYPVSGGHDVFCDSRSLITGGGNVSNATSIQCPNMLPGASEPVPW
jgi:hypothetical protein